LSTLKGRKFKLDCGHHVTFGHFLGNAITIYNGKHPTIICTQCGY
jgi:predicted nucleic-acid-binding Zn-ribbon protein